MGGLLLNPPESSCQKKPADSNIQMSHLYMIVPLSVLFVGIVPFKSFQTMLRCSSLCLNDEDSPHE